MMAYNDTRGKLTLPELLGVVTGSFGLEALG